MPLSNYPNHGQETLEAVGDRNMHQEEETLLAESLRRHADGSDSVFAVDMSVMLDSLPDEE